MSSLMTTLGIDRLSPAERIQLIAELIDSMPEHTPPPLTEDQRQELHRRLRLMDADPASLRPWAEVEARLLKRLTS